MERKKMPKSIRKFIRQEKAQIRREVLDIKKQEELIAELYKKLIKPSITTSTEFSKRKAKVVGQVEVALSGKKNENKRNLQPSNK
jgi:hypothetical protein